MFVVASNSLYCTMLYLCCSKKKKNPILVRDKSPVRVINNGSPSKVQVPMYDDCPKILASYIYRSMKVCPCSGGTSSSSVT